MAHLKQFQIIRWITAWLYNAMIPIFRDIEISFLSLNLFYRRLITKYKMPEYITILQDNDSQPYNGG